ncbi:hypothetical protein ACUNV4_00925 [Granulosicoccus sp. 3-233]|uniref:hypothetical protein n=1 Tax=Granulosicoccus sp. 3-233 TaxID=3417969 RepID=UPI003D34EE45
MNVAFATRRRHFDAQRDTLAFSSECPSCNLVTHFWMTHMSSLTDGNVEDEPASLYMLPTSESRLNLSAISELLPDNALQYCASTQDVFQSGNHTATRVMVKSTLDSIFTSFLPKGNSHSSLFKTVQDSLPAVGLDEPLMKLAASLRKGEPLDRLLANSDPASPETAEALMKLVEKLVHYLYVIPREFQELDQQLTELSQQLPASSEAAGEDVDQSDSEGATAETDPDQPEVQAGEQQHAA